MQLSAVQYTMPFSGSLCSAWNGHPAAHAGSRHCMHCRLIKEEGEPSVGLYSLIMLRVCSFRSVGAWCNPSPRVSGGVSFASEHAATQALHPMQIVASYRRPTAVLGTVLVSLSACSVPVPTATATAAVPPVLAIVVISSRRVMVTSVLFIAGSGFLRMCPIRRDSLHSRLFAAPEALRSHPRRASDRSCDGAHQHGRARLDFSRTAVNWRVRIRRRRQMNRHSLDRPHLPDHVLLR